MEERSGEIGVTSKLPHPIFKKMITFSKMKIVCRVHSYIICV